MKRALVAGAAYFIALFALGFVLGSIRVLLVVPHWGEMLATLAEVPVMLIAALSICRWVIQRWRVPPASRTRWAMALWFLALLLLFEGALGTLLFGRTMDQQWAALTSPAGLLGLGAQIVAAVFPLFVGRDGESLR